MQKKNTNKRIIALLMWGVLLICMSMAGSLRYNAVLGAIDPVRIWDFASDEHRLNRNIVVGVDSGDKIGYKLSGISEKSHSWSVDDSSVCSIKENGDTLSLEGKSEGTTWLRLSLTDTEGKKYNEKTAISVYTPFSNISGKISKSTMFRRAAHSGADNKNERGKVPEGTELSIYGECGKYYRADIDYTFTDELNGSLGYVLKSDVNIPVKKIVLNTTALEMYTEDTETIEAVIEPSRASNKNIIWSSSDKRIATVDTKGKVVANKKGNVTITAASADGKVRASCTINIHVKTVNAASKGKTIKPKLTGKATSLKGVSLNVVNGSKTAKECYVSIGGKKASLKTYSIYFKGKKLQKNRFTLKEGQSYKISISKLKKNKKHLFKVGKKGYMSKGVSITTGRPDLTVVQKGKHLLLKWNKIKNSKGYKIYRGGSASAAKKSTKVYKTIKSEKTKQFVDKDVKSGVMYYYVVKATKGKKTVAVGRMVIDTAYNLEFAKKSDLFKNVAINSDSKWNANGYTLPNGTYPPVKYRFTGKKLEIHLYIDFVRYDQIASNDPKEILVSKRNDPQNMLEGTLCSELFIKGLKEGYHGIRITSGGGNFGAEGLAFDTKLIVHRARKENYAPAQRFVQVRIGGLSPWYLPSKEAGDYSDFKGDLWFHASMYVDTTSKDIEYLPYIHMPTNAQLNSNKGYYSGQSKDSYDYMGTAAHEMGHILGLNDAYALKDNNGNVTQDRCAENAETCKKEKSEDKYDYYCLMKGGYHLVDTSMRANDFEMMMKAYNSSDDGIPQQAYQYYKTIPEGNISEVIKNRKDELDE